MMNLNVVEKLVLCVLDKEKSNSFLLLSNTYPAVIGASVFMELFLEDAIKLNEDKKIVVKNQLVTDKEYLKEVYERIQNEKPRKFKKWIESYGAGFSVKCVKNIVCSVAECLEKEGVLKVAKEKGMFKEKVRYEADEDAVKSIIDEIRSEFIENESLTKECVSLTVLVNQCQVLKKVLSKDEKKLLREKINDIKKNNTVEGVKELHEVICELEMSVMAACVAGSFQ